MIAHNGLCLVHRAQLKLIEGDWDAALEEARRSADRFTRGALNALACGEAHYCQGEAHRLRGNFDEAEDAYQQASQHGREPQPGLSLMRLSQGKVDAAAAAIRRVIGETTVPAVRAGRLPAYVEIMIASGSLELARAGCRELDELSAQLRSEALEAMAAGSRGAVALAENAGRVTRSSSFGARWWCCRNSVPGTRSREFACRLALRAAHLVTRTQPASSLPPPGAISKLWARCPIWLASRR